MSARLRTRLARIERHQRAFTWRAYSHRPLESWPDATIEAYLAETVFGVSSIDDISTDDLRSIMEALRNAQSGPAT